MALKIGPCPKCGNTTFIATAHVTQTWLVDEDGDFIEAKSDCDEFTFSQEMYPTEEKIDNLKKQALRLLTERIRRETDWHEKELVLKNADVYVLVDGMNDKSAEEKVALEMKI